MLIGFRMRVLILGLGLLAALVLGLPTPTRAQVCIDDYATVETYVGTLLEIVPAPEPFSSADLLIKGPDHCSPLWMQVLKSDAAQCRIGDRIEARGIIVSDPENAAWNLNPTEHVYMLLGQDYSCTR
jgi:hypothetical protein